MYADFSFEQLLAESQRRLANILGQEGAAVILSLTASAFPIWWGSEAHRQKLIRSLEKDDCLC